MKKTPTKRRPVLLRAKTRKTVRQFLAAFGAAILPAASFTVAHWETDERPWMWALVAAALAFSAPTLAEWATVWSGSRVKAWGFTILLEGVMIASHVPALYLAGLAILVAINGTSAWSKSAAPAVP